MANKNQHVVPLGNGWAVKSAGTQKATIITSKQADAITVARTIAKNNHTELFVYGKDGKIRGRDSYSKDIYPPKE